MNTLEAKTNNISGRFKLMIFVTCVMISTTYSLFGNEPDPKANSNFHKRVLLLQQRIVLMDNELSRLSKENIAKSPIYESSIEEIRVTAQSLFVSVEHGDMVFLYGADKKAERFSIEEKMALKALITNVETCVKFDSGESKDLNEVMGCLKISVDSILKHWQTIATDIIPRL